MKKYRYEQNQEWDALGDYELLQESAVNPDAFGVFYDRHIDAVIRFLVRRTACKELSADLAAETFAAAFIARKRYRDRGGGARPWIMTIAHNKLVKTMKRGQAEDRARKRLGIPRVEMTDESFERAEQLADIEGERKLIAEAVEQMPGDLAAAVYLRVGLDLPYAEVARRLDCTEGAARVRVMRGLAKLAERMEVA